MTPQFEGILYYRDLPDTDDADSVTDYLDNWRTAMDAKYNGQVEAIVAEVISSQKERLRERIECLPQAHHDDIDECLQVWSDVLFYSDEAQPPDVYLANDNRCLATMGDHPADDDVIETEVHIPEMLHSLVEAMVEERHKS